MAIKDVLSDGQYGQSKDKIHSIYESRYVSLKDSQYSFLDKEIDYIESELSKHSSTLHSHDDLLLSQSNTINNHIANKSNPHAVTKTQVGLGRVDDTPDSAKNVLSATKFTTARKVGNVSFDGTRDITVQEIGFDKDGIIKEMTNLFYPVGKCIISMTNVNPGTYLKGTVWRLTSKGAYLRGVDPNNANLSTVKDGGSNSINTSHTHSIGNHYHTIDHAHSINGHTHTIAHSHSINGHTHTVNDHSHWVNGHTLTINEMPTHSHTMQNWNDANGWDAWYPGNGGNAGIGVAGISWPLKTHHAWFGMDSTGGGASHDHGWTGGRAPNTNSVGLTTNSGGGNSGSVGLTTNSGGGNSSSVGLTTVAGGGNITIEPGYQTLYVWERTA